jgi:ComF family protein
LEKKKISQHFNPQKEAWKHLNGLIYGVDYHQNPAIQAMINQFKYKFNQQMLNNLTELMMEKLQQLSMVQDKPIVLIPIPLHSRRQRERGFNQAELLCKELKSKYSADLKIQKALKRVKYTSQQAKLNCAERQKNLNEAFEIRPDADLEILNQSVCFLVDDVCTTGATLENAAIILKKSGVERVYGLVAARAFK